MSKSFAEDEYFGSFGKGGGVNTFKRCYESHPPLPLGDGSTVIYGGSCLDPIVKDADVYIGLDHGMKRANRWPWEAPGPIEVFFPITDGHAPKDIDAFKKLVEWTALQLSAGKKVHAGCIGGHGRTGTFFAALVAHINGEPNAIQYVREHYCAKTVESTEQVNFLMKHYGCTTAVPSKAHLAPHAGGGKGGKGSSWPSGSLFPSDGGKVGGKGSSKSTGAGGKHTTVVPVKSHKDIWAGAVV